MLLTLISIGRERDREVEVYRKRERVGGRAHTRVRESRRERVGERERERGLLPSTIQALA